MLWVRTDSWPLDAGFSWLFTIIICNHFVVAIAVVSVSLILSSLKCLFLEKNINIMRVYIMNYANVIITYKKPFTKS